MAKYYQPAHVDSKATGPAPFRNPFQTDKEKRAFEQSVWEKTRRAQGQSTGLSVRVEDGGVVWSGGRLLGGCWRACPSWSWSSTRWAGGVRASSAPRPCLLYEVTGANGCSHSNRAAGRPRPAAPRTPPLRTLSEPVADLARSPPLGDILLYANQLILYKSSIDLTFYLIGPQSENELMLSGVLSALHDSISLLLRHQVEKRSILENLDLVVLALDETVDNGIVLETDPVAIASRVSRPRPDAGVNLSEITINEQTLMAVSRPSHPSSCSRRSTGADRGSRV